MSAKNKESLSKKDYERLGRILVSVFESGYAGHGRVYRINLLRGIFFGLGSVIGATLVVTTLIWLLTFFEELPLVGKLAEIIRVTIQ